MDLEFITAMLNHKEILLIFKTLSKYKSPFIVLFDNMTDRLAVIFFKYIVKYYRTIVCVHSYKRYYLVRNDCKGNFDTYSFSNVPVTFCKMCVK